MMQKNKKQQQKNTLATREGARLLSTENLQTLAPRLVTLTVTLHTQWGGSKGGRGEEEGDEGGTGGGGTVRVRERVSVWLLG